MSIPSSSDRTITSDPLTAKPPHAPRERQRRSSRMLVLTGLIAASVLVSAGAVEAVLRWSGRVPIPPTRIVTERPELYQEYTPYGYRLFPSRTTTYLYPRQHPRELTVRSNRHGFRGGRELDEPDARPRVLVLGDSMVFGEGVEERERFTEQLEAANPAWHVDNLGMTGFGTDLMLRAFEQVGLDLRPAIVILTIYTDDIRRVRPEFAGAGFRIPRFALQAGHLVSVEYPRPHFWRQWRIVAAAREGLWRLSGAEWKLNTAILDRFLEHAARQRFKLVLVFMPGSSDTENDQTRRAWLRRYADRTGTAFLDLTDPILGKRDRSLFIPGNWHLSPSGHLVVANELRHVLDGSPVQPSR